MIFKNLLVILTHKVHSLSLLHGYFQSKEQGKNGFNLHPKFSWSKGTMVNNQHSIVSPPIENKLVVAGGRGEGWSGSLRLADAN